MPSADLSMVTIEPSSPHTHTVVFLHGRGDTARQFAASLRRSCDSRGRSPVDALPSFRWVFPQAPQRPCASAPSVVWPQWFDVWNVRDFADREGLQAAGLREMVPAVRALLAEEAARLGGRWDRVVLAGISMGGATGVHTLFNLGVPAAVGGGPGRIGAFWGFSSRCPFAGRTLAEMRTVLGLDGVPVDDGVLRNTPVLLEHCVNDPLVLVEYGRRLRETLSGFGAQVVWKEYPDGGHWFNSPRGMDDLVDFVHANLFETRPLGERKPTQADAAIDVMDLS